MLGYRSQARHLGTSDFSIRYCPRAALLVLASGFLFTALMAIPLLLSFPGTFTATGLLGDGVQTNGWLSAFWVSGYPLAAIGYAVLKDRAPGASGSHGSSRTAVAVSVAVSVVSLSR
jgi:hypothetical protein